MLLIKILIVIAFMFSAVVLTTFFKTVDVRWLCLKNSGTLNGAAS